MGYRFEFERFDDRGIRLAFGGEIDTAVLVELRPGWPPLLEGLRPDRLVIDLSQVTFIDSSGISLLILTQKAVETGGGVTWIEGASGMVQYVLEVTGVDKALQRPPSPLP